MNINELMKQAKKMQSEIEQKEKALFKKEFTVEKQGITMKFNGQRKLLAVTIDVDLIDPEDKDILEDLIRICTNEAMDLINEEHDKLEPKNNGNMPY